VQRCLGCIWGVWRGVYLRRCDNAVSVTDFDIPMRGTVSHVSPALVDDARYRLGWSGYPLPVPAFYPSRWPRAAPPALDPGWLVFRPGSRACRTFVTWASRQREGVTRCRETPLGRRRSGDAPRRATTDRPTAPCLELAVGASRPPSCDPRVRPLDAATGVRREHPAHVHLCALSAAVPDVSRSPRQGSTFPTTQNWVAVRSQPSRPVRRRGS
jgi:hypothetical protein